jgi:hypothetical protein
MQKPDGKAEPGKKNARHRFSWGGEAWEKFSLTFFPLEPKISLIT